MSNKSYLVEEVYLTQIADKIRSKTLSEEALIFPSGFLEEIDKLGAESGSGFPEFTYTGQWAPLIDDGKEESTQNWRLKLLTTGTLTFTKDPGTLDVFLVGGGGNGAVVNNSGGSSGGGGGAGGKTLTIGIKPTKNEPYEIVVGGSAGDTSAFGATAEAGGSGSGSKGGSGGSGGGGGGASVGGTNGGDGTSAKGSGGLGQGTNTYEFGEEGTTLYSGGGGGGAWGGSTSNYGQAGDETAGSGGNKIGGNGLANRGGGGGGAGTTAGLGGSGIVIIRNHRS